MEDDKRLTLDVVQLFISKGWDIEKLNELVEKRELVKKNPIRSQPKNE